MNVHWPNRERISPNHARKLSAVLLEFAEQITPRGGEPRAFRNAVTLAVLLWNVGLLPETEQGAGMMEIRQQLQTGGYPLLETSLYDWLDLRKARYGNDRRLIMDYQLELTAEGPALTVVSLDLDRPEHRKGPPGSLPSETAKPSNASALPSTAARRQWPKAPR